MNEFINGVLMILQPFFFIIIFSVSTTSTFPMLHSQLNRIYQTKQSTKNSSLKCKVCEGDLRNEYSQNVKIEICDFVTAWEKLSVMR